MKTTKEAMGLFLVVGLLFLAGCTSTPTETTTTTQETMTEPTTTLPPTTMITTTMAMATTTKAATTTTVSQQAGNIQYITIDAFDFDPRWATIRPGDTVVWTNKQQSQMTVTSSDNSSELNSQVLGPTDTYSHTFNTVGTYNYYSTVHPQAVGTIYVQEGVNVTNPGTGALNSAEGEGSAGEPGIANYT